MVVLNQTRAPTSADDAEQIAPDDVAADATPRLSLVVDQCPYLFLARHTLELWLKAVIMPGQESLGLVQDLPDHHDLQRLWTSAFPIIKLRGKLENLEIDRMRSVVEEYHGLDPGSYSFRYPVNRKNKSIQHDPRVRAFSLNAHSAKFEEVQGLMSKLIRSLKLSIMWSRAILNCAQQGDAADGLRAATDL